MKMRIGLVVTVALCGMALATWRLAARADDGQDAAEKERARVAALRKQREARERSLKANWPRGDIEVLRKMKPEEIVRMQIFAAEYPRNVIDAQRTHVKGYLESSFGGDQEDRGAVAAVLALLSRAEAWERPGPGVPWEPSPENRVLVVQPVEGEPFEFVYSGDFDAPLAGLASRKLKEALYALSGGRSQVSVIRMAGGKVQETLHESLIAPHTGGVASQRMSSKFLLTPEKGLTVAIKVRRAREVLMEDAQPLHYGQAKVFASRGPDTWIVLLNRP